MTPVDLQANARGVSYIAEDTDRFTERGGKRPVDFHRSPHVGFCILSPINMIQTYFCLNFSCLFQGGASCMFIVLVIVCGLSTSLHRVLYKNFINFILCFDTSLSFIFRLILCTPLLNYL